MNYWKQFNKFHGPIWGAGKTMSKSVVQSQESLYDQLKQVRYLANQNGFYDAADYITKVIESIELADSCNPKFNKKTLTKS